MHHPFPTVPRPTLARALADGTGGTPGAGVVGAHELRAGAVTLDRMADMAEGGVIGRASGAGAGAPQVLSPAEIRALAEAAAPEACHASRDAAVAAAVPAGAAALRTLGWEAPGDGGGALHFRVFAEPAHPGKLQTGDGAWWELGENPARPEMFGAVGDGASDDRAAVQAMIDFCAATGAEGRLPGRYGIAAPLVIGEAQNGVVLRGAHALGETPGDGAVIALAGFTGAAMLIDGDATAPHAGSMGGTIENVRFDGGGRAGFDGIQSWMRGYPALREVYVHRCGTGWGIRIDGGWFPVLDRVVSRFNGDAASGGGLFLSNESRECSDGIVIRPSINSNGNEQVRFDRRADDDVRQAKWHFFGGEILGNAGGYAHPASCIVRIKGCDKVQFFGTAIQDTANETGHDLVLLAEAGHVPAGTVGKAIEALEFHGCDFQWQGAGAAIRFEEDSLDSLSIIGGAVKASGRLLSLAGLTSGEVRVHGAGAGPEGFDDPAGLIRNAPGAAVGARLGGAGDAVSLRSRIEGAPVRIEWEQTGGAVKSVGFGTGAGENRVQHAPASFLNLPLNAAEPAGPETGDIAASDGAAWDPTGRGAQGLQVRSGGAWRSLIAWDLEGAAVYDPPSLASGEGATATVPVPGAAPGDMVTGVSFGADLQGVAATGWVGAPDLASVRFQNGTGAAVDLGSATLRVRVQK